MRKSTIRPAQLGLQFEERNPQCCVNPVELAPSYRGGQVSGCVSSPLPAAILLIPRGGALIIITDGRRDIGPAGPVKGTNTRIPFHSNYTRDSVISMCGKAVPHLNTNEAEKSQKVPLPPLQRGERGGGGRVLLTGHAADRSKFFASGTPSEFPRALARVRGNCERTVLTFIFISFSFICHRKYVLQNLFLRYVWRGEKNSRNKGS